MIGQKNNRSAIRDKGVVSGKEPSCLRKRYEI